MSFLFGLFIVCVIILVIFILSTKNDNKTYEQIQREVAGIVDKPKEVDYEQLCKRVEVMIQAEVVGDVATTNAVNNGIYRGPWPEARADGGYLSIYDNLRILAIAGLNHVPGIKSYTGRINAALVPDPKNEYDHNAIKVVAEGGHQIGFIKRDQTEMVRSWVGDQFPHYCITFIQEKHDELDGHTFYIGHVYIKTK